MTKYDFEISCVKEENSVYKKIFDAFGHTGSLMNLEVFESLDEQQKKAVCNVYFMVNSDRTAQILCPVNSSENLDSPNGQKATSVIAVNKAIKTCEKYDFAVDCYISSTPKSDMAKIFHFDGDITSAEVEGCTFYQMEKAQNLNQNVLTKSSNNEKCM